MLKCFESTQMFLTNGDGKSEFSLQVSNMQNILGRGPNNSNQEQVVPT